MINEVVATSSASKTDNEQQLKLPKLLFHRGWLGSIYHNYHE